MPSAFCKSFIAIFRPDSFKSAFLTHLFFEGLFDI